MTGSADSGSSKRGGVPIRPEADRADGGEAPAFLGMNEAALLRLEAGLRAQREQQARSPSPPRRSGATEPGRDSQGRRAAQPDPAPPLLEARRPGKGQARAAAHPFLAFMQVEARSESPPLAPEADQPEARLQERASSWRRRKTGLVLCALLIVVGAAAVNPSLRDRASRWLATAPGNVGSLAEHSGSYLP